MKTRKVQDPAMGHSTEKLSTLSLVRLTYSTPTSREALPARLLVAWFLQVAAALQGSHLLITPQHRGSYPIPFVGNS